MHALHDRHGTYLDAIVAPVHLHRLFLLLGQLRMVVPAQRVRVHVHHVWIVPPHPSPGAVALGSAYPAYRWGG